MPKAKLQNIAALIAALLILLFLYTAITKLADRTHFAAVMDRSPLLKNVNVLLSWTIPAVEIGLCILLFLPQTRETGLLCSWLLMAIFTGYISYMLMTSSNLPCSCGGIFTRLSWRAHLGINAAITIMAFAGWRYEKRFNDLLINRSS